MSPLQTAPLPLFESAIQAYRRFRLNPSLSSDCDHRPYVAAFGGRFDWFNMKEC